jgi:hypothetical protein
LSLLAQCLGLLGIDSCSRATNTFAHRLRMSDASPHALHNQIALKLRHCSHDVEEQLAARSRGVDAMAQLLSKVLTRAYSATVFFLVSWFIAMLTSFPASALAIFAWLRSILYLCAPFSCRWRCRIEREPL